MNHILYDIKMKEKNVRRCKQIIEIVDIDPQTNEVLTNEVFEWDLVDDKYIYSGKSYILERIRIQSDMSKIEMKQEMERRVEILDWMHKNGIREFKDFAKIVFSYTENPNKFIKFVRENLKYKIEKIEPNPIKEARAEEVEQIYNKKENENENDTNLNKGKVKNNSGFFLIKRKIKRGIKWL